MINTTNNETDNKEYRIMYDYNGHSITAGQTGWIPSKLIASKIIEQRYSEKLYLQERIAENPVSEILRYLNDKPVYSEDLFYIEALCVGDYVESSIINDLLNCLPPACMRSDCSQLGEVVFHTEDKNGKHRPVYHTFAYVDEDTCKYIGCCFRGEYDNMRKCLETDNKDKR